MVHFLTGHTIHLVSMEMQLNKIKYILSSQSKL